MSYDQARAIDVPEESEGSYWPLVLALTLTLTMIGLMVHIAIALVGAVLSVAAIVLWNLQRFVGPSSVETEPSMPPSGTALAARGDTARPANYWGMVWFIATEATLFAFLIAAYVFLRANSQTWPPSGTPEQTLAFPILNTIILLLSGVPAFYAERSIRNNNRRGLQIGLVLAAIMGLIFLGGQVYEYINLGMSPQTNIFAAGFYVLTGFHGGHVLVGVGLLIAVLLLSRTGRYSAAHNFPVQFAGTYWHFVDIVWVFLFTLLYIIR